MGTSTGDMPVNNSAKHKSWELWDSTRSYDQELLLNSTAPVALASWLPCCSIIYVSYAGIINILGRNLIEQLPGDEGNLWEPVKRCSFTAYYAMHWACTYARFNRRELINAGFIFEIHIKIRIWAGPSVFKIPHIDGLAQHCSNSSANALELLQSCTKLST